MALVDGVAYAVALQVRYLLVRHVQQLRHFRIDRGSDWCYYPADVSGSTTTAWKSWVLLLGHRGNYGDMQYSA